MRVHNVVVSVTSHSQWEPEEVATLIREALRDKFECYGVSQFNLNSVHVTTCLDVQEDGR